MCQTPTKRQTDRRTCPFVHCVCQGRSSYEGTNRGSTNKYTEFGQLITRKIIKIIAKYVTF